MVRQQQLHALGVVTLARQHEQRAPALVAALGRAARALLALLLGLGRELLELGLEPLGAARGGHLHELLADEVPRQRLALRRRLQALLQLLAHLLLARLLQAHRVL